MSSFAGLYVRSRGLKLVITSVESLQVGIAVFSDVSASRPFLPAAQTSMWVAFITARNVIDSKPRVINTDMKQAESIKQIIDDSTIPDIRTHPH